MKTRYTVIQKSIYILLIIITFCSFSQCTAGSANIKNPFPEKCWGVYSWSGWKPDTVNKKNCPLVKGAPIILHWNKVEPEPGEFKFHEQLDEKLNLAVENGFYTFLMLWVAPNAPGWLYENGVPELKMTPTISPRRTPRNWTFQYYLDEDYINYYYRLIGEFGRYVRNLPDNLKERILYIQSAEGSTGDGYCYKGQPIEEKYSITREQWSQFRIRAWEVYKESLTGSNGNMVKPILVNYDSNREDEYNWLLANFDVIGLKNGMFSHGYHISETQQRLKNWKDFIKDVTDSGKVFFSRGEQDAEWQVCGWSSRNTRQALYWSSLFATHCGLDMWNLPNDACQGQTYSEAINLFNKYAGYHEVSTAPAAFCALRKGLDAADTLAYPESIFGEAKKSNVDRYLRIADAFSVFGAIQGDPEKATGGGMKNRQRDNYNDVGWKILPGNYCRYLEQIDPEQTSIGFWHVQPQDNIYSRFARGFDHANGKVAMYFKLDPSFFGSLNQPNKVKLRIIYLDRGNGQWGLFYNRNNREEPAFDIRCQDSGSWIEKTAILDQALFNGNLERGADLILKHLGDDDTIFHLIEIERY